MLKIAVSGNIASGKSEAEKIIRSLGYKTICADELSHLALLDSEIKKQIFDIFKTIKREDLAKVVFSNKEKKEALENIIHPFVIKKIDDFFLKNKDEELLFAFVPLLFEAKLQDKFDKIIFLQSDDETRLKRLMDFRGYSRDYAILRMKSQMEQEEKIKQSDYVILNNTNLKELKTQIQQILNKLKQH